MKVKRFKKYKITTQTNNMNKISTYFFLTLFNIFVFCGVTEVNAMVLLGREDQSFESYTTFEDDLYGVGEKLVFNGTTTGDVFVAGSYIEQGGVVTEDVFLVGGILTTSGDIAGDVRMVGGKVTVSGHVGEDLLASGATIVVDENAVIDGGVLIFAETVVIKGKIQGLTKIYAQNVEIEGEILNSIEVKVSEALSVREQAVITGNLVYTAPREAFISDTTSVGGVSYIQGVATQKRKLDVLSFVGLVLVTLVSALLLSSLFPAQTRYMVQKALETGGALRTLKGLLLIFVFPLLGLILCLTLVGIVPGLFVFTTYGVVILITLALSPVLASVLLVRWFKKEKEAELRPQWVLFGSVVFSLLVFIPVIGWLTRTIVFLLAFYAVVSTVHEFVWKKRKESSLESNTAQKYEENNTNQEEEKTTDSEQENSSEK
jgi:cytoskeletal protein CcmA (bactofilin family)